MFESSEFCLTPALVRLELLKHLTFEGIIDVWGTGSLHLI